MHLLIQPNRPHRTIRHTQANGFELNTVLQHLFLRKTFQTGLLFCILSVLPLTGSAKSFLRNKPGGHEADQYSVVPFSRSEQISDWLEIIHKTIDFPYNTYFETIGIALEK